MNQRLFDELQIRAEQKVRSAVMEFLKEYSGGQDAVYNPGRNVPINNSGGSVRRPEMVPGNNAVEPGRGLDGGIGN
jgi:hypothetical protein